MSPDVILLIGQMLVKYGPTVVREFVALFNKPDVTPADVAAFVAKVESMDFEELFAGRRPAVPQPNPQS
jgi:hypothetical protein